MGVASTSQQGPWGPQREPGWAPPAPCALSPLPQPDMGEVAHGRPAGWAHLGRQGQDTHTSRIPRAHTQSQRHTDIHSPPETQTHRDTDAQTLSSTPGPLGTSRQDGEGRSLELLEESHRLSVPGSPCGIVGQGGGGPARVTQILPLRRARGERPRGQAAPCV